MMNVYNAIERNTRPSTTFAQVGCKIAAGALIAVSAKTVNDAALGVIAAASFFRDPRKALLASATFTAIKLADDRLLYTALLIGLVSIVATRARFFPPPNQPLIENHAPNLHNVLERFRAELDRFQGLNAEQQQLNAEQERQIGQLDRQDAYQARRIAELHRQDEPPTVEEINALTTRLKRYFKKLKNRDSAYSPIFCKRMEKEMEGALPFLELLSSDEGNMSSARKREVFEALTRLLTRVDSYRGLEKSRQRQFCEELSNLLDESLGSLRPSVGKEMPQESARSDSPRLRFDASEPLELTELVLEFQDACRKGEEFTSLFEKLNKLRHSSRSLTAKILRNIEKTEGASAAKNKEESEQAQNISKETFEKDRILKLFTDQITSRPITKKASLFLTPQRAYLCEYDKPLVFKVGMIVPIVPIRSLIKKRLKLYKNPHATGAELPHLKHTSLVIEAITQLIPLSLYGDDKIIADLFLILKEMTAENAKSAAISGNEKLILLAGKLTHKVEKLELLFNQLIQIESQEYPPVSFDNGIPPELASVPIFSLFISGNSKRPICFDPYFDGHTLQEAKGIENNNNITPLPAVKALIEAQKSTFNSKDRGAHPSAAILAAAFVELQTVFPAFPQLHTLQQLIKDQKNPVEVPLPFHNGIPPALKKDMIFRLFECPITGASICKFALDPTDEKTLYEKRDIKKWVDKNHNSPTTRIALKSKELIPRPKLDDLISSRIRSYQAKKWTQGELNIMLTTPPNLTSLQEALTELKEYKTEDPGLQAMIGQREDI